MLFLKETKASPFIWLDSRTAKGVVVGNSMTENAAALYSEIVAWMEANLPLLTRPMEWRFQLTYFNTSSMKGLYQVLLRIRTHAATGHVHTIVWDVVEDDEFMRESGESFVEILGIPISFRELSEEEAFLEHDALKHHAMQRSVAQGAVQPAVQ